MEQFKMYEVVVAKEQLSSVPKGTKGTILMIFEDAIHYEVEFIDDNGNTLNVLTVPSTSLEKYVQSELLAVTERVCTAKIASFDQTATQ